MPTPDPVVLDDLIARLETPLTDREQQVLCWMLEQDVDNGDRRWYTNQIKTSAKLLKALDERGLVRRHDPHTNFFVRAGSMCIRWSLSDAGRQVAGGLLRALRQETSHAE